MLQYSQFDECIDFLTTPIEQFYKTDPNRTALLGSVEVIIENYIKFFTEELESAILSKGTPDQKNDLIRFYVSRLMKSINHRSFKFLHSDSQAIIPNANENTPASFWINGNLVLNPSEDPNNDLRYKRGCNILYHLLFDQLQECCDIYDIPFLKICKKLNFPIEDINIQISARRSDINSQPIPSNIKLDEVITNFDIKPIFKQESIPEILAILNVYFSDHHKELLKILIYGDIVHEKLVFLAHSNKLTDAFRKMFSGKLITRCNKKQLGEWVVDNFNYSVNDIIHEFSFKKIYKTLSGSDEVCKNPILNVENGRVVSASEKTRTSY